MDDNKNTGASNDCINEQERNKFREEYKKSISRDEYDREVIDQKNRKTVRDELVTNRKKIQVDEITGEPLHVSSNAAKNKLGDGTNSQGFKNSAKRSLDVDHTISVKAAYERHKNNYLLKNEDLVNIFDSEMNFTYMNKSYNTSKREQSNIEFAIKNRDRLSNKEIANLVKKQAEAEVKTGAAVLNAMGRNATEISMEGAKFELISSAAPLGMRAAQGMIDVINNEKDLDEFLLDTTGDVGTVAIKGAGKEHVYQIVENTKVLRAAKKEMMENKAVQSATKLAANSTVVKTVEVALLIKDSTLAYIDGHIDEVEYVLEIAKETTKAYIAQMAFVVGHGVLPVVGGIVASVVAVQVCEVVFDSVGALVEGYRSRNEYLKDISKYNQLAREAVEEIVKQQDSLKALAKEYFEEFDRITEESFDEMFESIVGNDVEGFARGMDELLEFFGKNVRFESYEEFDEFFMDEDSVLKL